MTRTRPSSTNATLTLAAGLAISAIASTANTARAQTGPFPAELHVDDLNGSNGFTIDGIPTLSGLGASVSDAGDLNGDGVDDFIVARAIHEGAGATYVVFGVADGFPAVIDVEDLTGTNGFRIDGFGPADILAQAVARAGDVNGDGIDDIIIGAERAAGSDGRASVVFGRTTGFPAVLALADLDGGDGFTLLGEKRFGYGVGSAVAGAGDINGDGIDDIIVGSDRFYGASRDSGRAIVVFGRTTGFDATIPVDDLNGANGFALIGSEYRTQLGISVAPAGDINGDGFDDVIVGSADAPSHPYYYYTREGSAYVIYGRDTASAGDFPVRISSSRFHITGLGFEIRGESHGQAFGRAVAPAGDVNGDGVDDVIIGARGARGGTGVQAGAAFVIYGRAPGEPSFPVVFEVADLVAADGVRFDGQFGGDRAGQSVAPLGDINGDGHDDVAIAAIGWGFPHESGVTYVVYGRPDNFPGSMLLETLDGEEGFRIRGKDSDDEFGWGLSSAGDINGDGVGDILVGAPFAKESGGAATGRAYLIYGSPGVCRPDLDGDGQLTIFDFLAFQNAFDAGDPIADFDGDGSLTIFDFLAFQNEFDAGCE